MKKYYAYIALVAAVIFTAVNFVGGLVNDAKRYAYGTDDVMGDFPIHLIYGLLFWLTCLPEIKIRRSLRLPILRTVFWTLFATGMWTGYFEDQMSAGDFIYAWIQPFCFFNSTIGLSLNHIMWLRDIQFDLIGILIIGMGLYQIAVLELATYIVKKITAGWDSTKIEQP